MSESEKVPAVINDHPDHKHGAPAVAEVDVVAKRAEHREDLIAISKDPEHLFNQFYFGSTMPFICAVDKRFSYFLHIPKCHTWDHEDESTKLPLVVAIHGTSRRAESLRNAYAPFAEANSCAILVPLFPVESLCFGDLESYKEILYQGTRYDEVLLSMIKEVASTYSIQSTKFFMAGFSGGAVFTQRFLFLHPERLVAVSLAAPGRITYPNKSVDWPHGVQNLAEKFGDKFEGKPSWEDVGKVVIQLGVGALDNDPEVVFADPDGSRTGRLDRAKALKAELEKLNISLKLTVVDGVAHTPSSMRVVTQKFLSHQLDLYKQ